MFVADDAFGSTEYRPEAAERWAVELDRVLRAMDERHWLIWTSRPAPLKAGLRRIHREHGVERFPQPAEVQIDAGDLDVEEKALILFRHAKAAKLPEVARRCRPHATAGGSSATSTSRPSGSAASSPAGSCSRTSSCAWTRTGSRR